MRVIKVEGVIVEIIFGTKKAAPIPIAIAPTTIALAYL